MVESGNRASAWSGDHAVNDPLIFESTGVVFRGQCDVKACRCKAPTCGAVTAVWLGHHGRKQVNVCSDCLRTKVKDGNWSRKDDASVKIVLPPRDTRRKEGPVRRERGVWFSDDEWEKVEAGARADGMRLQDWIRKWLLIEAELSIDDPIVKGTKVEASFLVPGRMGRPRRIIDPRVVDAALKAADYSVRGAAKILRIPQATLHQWVARVRRETEK